MKCVVCCTFKTIFSKRLISLNQDIVATRIRQQVKSFGMFSLNAHIQIIPGDVFVTGVVISGCLPVYHKSQLKGVVCIDRTVSDLLSDVTYFNKGELNYAFVLDGEARVLTHPLLPRPQTIRDDPLFIRLTSLERSPQTLHVMTSMIR